MGRGQTHTQADIATTRKNRPKGRFFENGGIEGKILAEICPPFPKMVLHRYKLLKTNI